MSSMKYVSLEFLGLNIIYRTGAPMVEDGKKVGGGVASSNYSVQFEDENLTRQ
jgi:hypothetical protein